MKRLQFLYTVPLLVLLFALSLVSCRDAIFDYSHPDPSDPSQSEVSAGDYFEATVSFSSTDLKVPTLRALDKAGENEIQTDKVKAYVFQSIGTSSTFLYEAKVTKVVPDATKNKAEGKITLLIKDSGDQLVKVFFVVNATPSQEPAVGTTLEEFQKLFVFSQKDTWRAGELPMYAESQAVKISHSSGAVPSLQKTPIPFLRAVARVDVMLGAKSGEKFDEITTGLKTKGGQDLKITSIKAFNVADKGYAMPLKANVENATTAPKVNATSLPEGLTKKSTPISYLADDTGVDALMRTIYIPELNNRPHDATAQADGQNKPEKDQTNYLARPYLILGIKGAVEGDASKVTYFRVDYLERTGEEPTATYKYLDILRNYRYMVNITNIGGPGFDNEEDAKEGPAANIMYNVLVWEESQMTNVVYDGQYMLGVNDDNLTFYKDGGTYSIKVQTSWPKGFEVKGLPDWLEVEPFKPTDETANKPTDEKLVTFKIKEPASVTEPRKGEAFIQAGRMKWKLNITQLNTLDVKIEIFSDPECTQELQYIELDERGKDTPTNTYTVGKKKFYVRVTPAAPISAVNDETRAPFTFTGAPAASPSRPPIETAKEVSAGVYEFEVTADPLNNPKNPFETRQNKYHFITEQSGEKAEATLSINQTEYNIVFYEDEDLTNPMLSEGDAATYFMNGEDKQFYVRSNIPYIIWMDNQMIDKSARNKENANTDGSSKFPIVTGYYDKDGKFVKLDYDSSNTMNNWRSVKTEEAPTPNGSPLKFRAAEADALKIIYGHVMWVACTTMKSLEWKFPLYNKQLANHDRVTKIQTNFVAGYFLPEANSYPITLGKTGLLIPIQRRINHAARYYEENFDTPFGWVDDDYQHKNDETAKIDPFENWESYKQRNQLNRLDDDDDISLEVLWTDIQSVTEKGSELARNPIKQDGTAPLKLLVPVEIKGERYAYVLPGDDGADNYGNLVFCVRDKNKKRVDNKRTSILDYQEQGKDVILWSFHLILYRPGEIPTDKGYQSAVDPKTITYLLRDSAKEPENYGTDWPYDVKVWPYALGAFDIPQEWRNTGNLVKNSYNLRDINYKRVGMYYQFGRKDPFPRYINAIGRPTRFVGHEGREVYFQFLKSTTISLRESIEYPMILVGNAGGHQWLTEGGKTYTTNISLGGTSSFGAYGLWGGGSPVGNESSCSQRTDIMRILTKTVFDPCPYGFRIPIPGYSSTRMFWGKNKVNADRMRMNNAVFMTGPGNTKVYNTYNGTKETLFGVWDGNTTSGSGQIPFAVATSYIAQAHYPVFMFTFGTAAPEERYQHDIHRSSPVVVRPFNNVQESDWEKYISR